MWGAVTHYLKAVQAAGTDAAAPVMAKMRETPINDFMTTNGSLRIDGRVIRDMYLMKAKQPSQARGEWDLLEVAQTIPGPEASARWRRAAAAGAIARFTRIGTGPLPHPATHERILDGWPGGGEGRCRAFA